ncbi:MAG: DNA polymerase [Syntrophobacteraceae bacterium]
MAVSVPHYNTPCPRDSRRHHKESTGLFPQRLADTGSQIIGTVHDEIILEVPDRLAGEAAVILKQTMIEAGKAYLFQVPVEVDVTIGEIRAEK